MPRDIMSEQQINIEFVKEVQKHPTLYNFELPSYSRKDVSDKAWEAVGNATNMTPSACRERWRNLRAVFMRTIKAAPKGTGKKKPYYLADVMQFVVPFMRPVAAAEAAREKKKPHTKVAHEVQKTLEAKDRKPVLVEIEQIKVEKADDDDSGNWCSISPEEEKEMRNTRKRSAPDEEQQQIKKTPQMVQTQMVQTSSSMMAAENDHVKSFLNSLLPELNEMNSAQFKNFKRRVLLLIDDITTEIPSSPKHTDDSEYII